MWLSLSSGRRITLADRRHTRLIARVAMTRDHTARASADFGPASSLFGAPRGHREPATTTSYQRIRLAQAFMPRRIIGGPLELGKPALLLRLEGAG